VSLLKTKDASGQERFWTLKEVVQGKPLGHPSHPMFVHFPVAFYIAVLVFDIMSRVGNFPEAPVAGTWLILGAFAATVILVTTGLVDWFGMVPGSRKRRWATIHMLLQLTAFGFFVANLAVRWPDRYSPEAETLWIVLGAVGVAFMTVGQWFGGILVYRMGMRVGSADDS
jgi:uncharacterized membrane protein